MYKSVAVDMYATLFKYIYCIPGIYHQMVRVVRVGIVVGLIVSRCSEVPTIRHIGPHTINSIKDCRMRDTFRFGVGAPLAVASANKSSGQPSASYRLLLVNQSSNPVRSQLYQMGISSVRRSQGKHDRDTVLRA